MYDRRQKVEPENFWWDYLNISEECTFQGGLSEIQGKSGCICMKQHWVVKPKFENFSAAEMRTLVPKLGFYIIIYDIVEDALY